MCCIIMQKVVCLFYVKRDRKQCLVFDNKNYFVDQVEEIERFLFERFFFKFYKLVLIRRFLINFLKTICKELNSIYSLHFCVI